MSGSESNLQTIRNRRRLLPFVTVPVGVDLSHPTLSGDLRLVNRVRQYYTTNLSQVP